MEKRGAWINFPLFFNLMEKVWLFWVEVIFHEEIVGKFWIFFRKIQENLFFGKFRKICFLEKSGKFIILKNLSVFFSENLRKIVFLENSGKFILRKFRIFFYFHWKIHENSRKFGFRKIQEFFFWKIQEIYPLVLPFSVSF